MVSLHGLEGLGFRGLGSRVLLPGYQSAVFSKGRFNTRRDASRDPPMIYWCSRGVAGVIYLTTSTYRGIYGDQMMVAQTMRVPSHLYYGNSNYKFLHISSAFLERRRAICTHSSLNPEPYSLNPKS